MRRVERRARSEVRLLPRAAEVPAAIAGVAQRDDQRRGLSRRQRGVRALPGPRAVEALIEAHASGDATVGDAAEVGVPVPAVLRGARIRATDPDRAVRGIREDREVRRAVDPPLEHQGRARVPGGEVLARPRGERRIPSIRHPLRG